MKENFPHLAKEIDFQEVQEAQRVPKKLDPRRNTPRHIIIKLVRIKDKERCWRGCGEKGTLMHCWWECRLVRPLWKTIWNFLRKLKMELPFDPCLLYTSDAADECVNV